MKSIISIVIFFIFSLSSVAQIISNVEFEAEKDKIIIYYDLAGDKDQEYEVSLVLRREEYTGFVFVPRSIEGDAGKGKFVGTKRKIVWTAARDYRIDPEIDDYYFEVRVKEIGGGIPWYYYVGAAVLGGGAAAALLLGKDNETTEERQPIGPPPVRP